MLRKFRELALFILSEINTANNESELEKKNLQTASEHIQQKKFPKLQIKITSALKCFPDALLKKGVIYAQILPMFNDSGSCGSMSGKLID